MSSPSSGPQVDISLHSLFASRKRNPAEEEKQMQAAILPSNFQVYAKIDEESRKDNMLSTSFLLTLNDARSSVTYEFRGVCAIRGSSADFESVMEAHKDSRIPKILDIIYQRLYPVVFMLAGMTSSSYPQSIALMTEMVSAEPIQVHQEAEPVPKTEKPKVVESKSAPESAGPAEVPRQTMAKVKMPSLGDGDKTVQAKI